MNIFIRVDSSNEIGTGHLIRCLNLAKALRKIGYDSHFICRDLKGNINSVLKQEKFKSTILKENSPEGFVSSKTGITHEAWLKVHWSVDVRQVQKVLQAEQADVMIVDHYGIDENWEKEIQKHVDKLIVIDDLADRKHVCDVLIDQSYSTEGPMRYQDLTPSSCQLLLGTNYVMMQPIYSERHHDVRVRSGYIKNVLLNFGGSDLNDVTGMVSKAFINAKKDDVVLNIVIGKQYKYKEKLTALTHKNHNIKIHSNLPTLAELIEKCDVAIGAAGTTTWERCCLGLPSYIIAIANNQVYNATQLSDKGCIKYIGHYDEVTEEIMTNNFKEILNNKNNSIWSQMCLDLVDGLGTQRIIDKVFKKK